MLRSTPDVEITKDRLLETWESTRDALAPRLSAAREVVTPYVDTASARVAPVLDEARARLSPTVERLGPAVETARVKLRTEVVPAVVAAAEQARDNSAPARAEAKERAAEAIRVLRGDKRRSRRWPLAVACLLGGAALGAAAGMMRRPPQQMPEPTPLPYRGETAEAPTTTGVAGASQPSATRQGTDQSAG